MRAIARQLTLEHGIFQLTQVLDSRLIGGFDSARHAMPHRCSLKRLFVLIVEESTANWTVGLLVDSRLPLSYFLGTVRCACRVASIAATAHSWYGICLLTHANDAFCHPAGGDGDLRAAGGRRTKCGAIDCWSFVGWFRRPELAIGFSARNVCTCECSVPHRLSRFAVIGPCTSKPLRWAPPIYTLYMRAVRAALESIDTVFECGFDARSPMALTLQIFTVGRLGT